MTTLATPLQLSNIAVWDKWLVTFGKPTLEETNYCSFLISLVFHGFSPVAFWNRITDNFLPECKTLDISTSRLSHRAFLSVEGNALHFICVQFSSINAETQITSSAVVQLKSCFCRFIVILCFHLDMADWFPIPLFPLVGHKTVYNRCSKNMIAKKSQ